MNDKFKAAISAGIVHTSDHSRCDKIIADKEANLKKMEKFILELKAEHKERLGNIEADSKE